ncbi:MAG: prolyl oligopeptidase family serine peptidase [Candidatus Lokiarchaeota archaeon]|nr:prolyl oligopeptidase family serine peptidase [Candidatus Lokiarchaeota archaeon]
MKKNQYIGVIILILSIIPVFFIVNNTIISKQINDIYLKENEIYLEYFEFPGYANTRINGICWMPENYRLYTNHSQDGIILIPGINSKKESNAEKCFELVKRGFFVFIIDKRGHGDSDGLLSLLAHEPFDIIKCIDYIELNYPQVNSSRIGLFGLSYGGGAALIAQTLEPRILTTVVYHPFSNISDLLIDFPIQHLIGNTLEIQFDEQSIKKNSPVEILNSSNTRNLLIIHGTDDITVKLEHSQIIYKTLSGDSRNDIELIERLDLNHVQNINNETSLKYAISWLLHYYTNSSINITNLDKEINYCQLYEFQGFTADNLEFFSVIFLFFLLISGWILFFGNMGIPYYSDIRNFRQKKKKSSQKSLNSLLYFKNQKAYPNFKIMIWISIIYISGSLITTLLSLLINPSLIIGFLFLGSLIIISGILLFLKLKLHTLLSIVEITIFEKEEIVFLIKNCIWIFSSFLIFGLVKNVFAYYIYSTGRIPIFTTTFLINIFLISFIFCQDFLVIRIFKLQYGLLINLLLRLITLSLFLLFVPLPSFNFPINTTFLFWLGIPLSAIFLTLITKILKPITKNEFGALILISVITSTILVYYFFRTI